MSGDSADLWSSVPPLPSRYVIRLRLLDALGRADATPLTLLSAGPGTGKTVLLSDWVRQRTTPIAWLTLRASANDPRRFWGLLLAAMRAGGLTQHELPSVWTTGAPEQFLESLDSRSAASPNPFALVLDDAHVLTHPEILELLDLLVWRRPPRIRLLIAARSDPLLPLHRYRLAGQMRELRAADLAMTREEVRELLAAHGVSLPDRQFEVLATRTEGWTAGVRLLALRLEETEQPLEVVSELALDHGSIGEYLMAEVLDRLPEQVRSVLVQTSFLDEVTGPLADAITGIGGCRAILTDLARRNSFVIALDPARSRFRYHQLLREILHYLAQRQSPDADEVLFGRAARWFAGHGDLPNALYWAARAGDVAQVAGLLVHGGLATAFVRRLDLSAAGLPAPAQMRPAGTGTPAQGRVLIAARAAILALKADAQTAAHEVQRLAAQRARADEWEPDTWLTLDLAELILAQTADLFAVVDGAAGRLLATNASAQIDTVPGLRASLLLAQAQARFNEGRPADAERLLQVALTLAECDDLPAVQADILANLARVEAYAARPRHAGDAESQAIALIGRTPGLARPAALDLALARRAYLDADIPAMTRAVRRAMVAGPRNTESGVVVAAAVLQASVLTSSRHVTAARAVLQKTAALNEHATGLFAVYRDCELAAIETALGRPRAALRLLAPYRGTPFAVCAAAPAARAYLRLGDLGRAENSVRSVITTPSAHVTRDLLVDAILCDAQIAQRGGHDAQALELIIRAIEIAGGDLALPFVRVADVFASLLARHPTVARRWPTARSAGGDETLVDAPPPRFAELPDALTDRERGVLRFLATSMSTAEIADELCLSINTVKTHMGAIYRKLAAHKRREAVLRAHELELL